MTLGCKKPQIILYLPNRPLMPDDGSQSIPDIIELNGNHWRKIFSIYAKITCNDLDWREYRDSQLLNQKESISFADQILAGNSCHLVAGKVNWLGICGVENNPQQQGFEAIDDDDRLWKRGNVILCPYLDYRQFPNELVATLVKVLIESKLLLPRPKL